MENEPENFPKILILLLAIGLRNRSFCITKTYLAKFFFNSPSEPVKYIYSILYFWFYGIIILWHYGNMPIK